MIGSTIEAELAECKAAYESQFKELHELKEELSAEREETQRWLKKAVVLKDIADEYKKLCDKVSLDHAALLKAISDAEPVAWAVYVADARNFYVVDSEDDDQIVDDCTNSDAKVWPLYTLNGIKK